MSNLVEKLAEGSHPVVVARYKDLEEFKQSIDRGFVLVKFTDTQGGTEIGFELNSSQSRTEDCDFDSGTGTVRLVGDLVLDFQKVRCIADIDIGEMEGEGRLEILN